MPNCMQQWWCRARAHMGAFGWLAVVIVVLAMPAPALAAGAVGRETAGRGSDRIAAGTAHAFRHRATASGRISRLNVRLARRNTASKLRLGLYADRRARPGRRLASCTVSRRVVGKRASCRVSPLRVTARKRYWTAILQPRRSKGRLWVRGSVRRGAASKRTVKRALRTLPRSFGAPHKRSAAGGGRASTVSLFADAPSSKPRPISSPAPAPAPSPAPLSCDVRVSGLPALDAAVGGPGNDGKTICVEAGGSGGTLRWSVKHDAMTRVVAVPGDGSVAIPGIDFVGASNITVEGFHLTSGSQLNDNPSHIRFVKNQMRDMSDDALDTHGAASDIWFVGNQVRNIRFTGDAFTGYGIQTFGGSISGLHVNYNTFDMGGESADALQLGDIHDFEIVGNVIRNVRYSGPAEDPHADAIMLWDGASRGLVKDNRITDSMTTLWSGSTSDVRLENNLIARMRGRCHDGGPTGSSDEGLVRYTWVRNTIYDCGSVWNSGGFGGSYGLLTLGPATAGASNTLSRNLLTSLDLGTSAQFASSDHNLIKNGDRPGATDLAFTPQFANLLDYRPTNLPAGYQDVGYRNAPAGHTAAP